MKQVIDNNTWELVALPNDRQPVDCKWVFRIKENVDGFMNKYKARLRISSSCEL